MDRNERKKKRTLSGYNCISKQLFTKQSNTTIDWLVANFNYHRFEFFASTAVNMSLKAKLW